MSVPMLDFSVLQPGLSATTVRAGTETLPDGTAELESLELWLPLVLAAVVGSLGILLWWRWRTAAGDPSHFPEGTKSPRREAPIVLRVILVAAVGTSATVAAVLTSIASARRETLAHFETARERVAFEIERRIAMVGLPLKGARGAYHAAGSLTRMQLQRYVQARSLATDFPGVLGIGFVKPFRSKDLQSFLAKERADEESDFVLRQLVGAEPAVSAAERDHQWRYAVTSCFPKEANYRAWGVEVGAEAVRREAIERAIATGEPSISGGVALVQSKGDSVGFLLLVPIFSADVEGLSVKERSDALVGLVYAPINLAAALGHISGFITDGLDFELFDGELSGPAKRLYDADGHLKADQRHDDPSNYSERLFRDERPFMVGGRTWTLVTSTLPSFDAAHDSATPSLLAGGGALLTILATAFSWLALSGRTRAIRYANRVTEDLRLAEASSDRLANIARLTSNAVIITDPTGRIEWVNEGFTRTTGYTFAEVLGRRPGDFLEGPETDSAAVARMREAVHRAQPYSLELVNYRRSGQAYRTHIELTPLRDSDGTLTGFMAVETDITAQWEVTTALREAKASAVAALRESAAFRSTLDEHSIISITSAQGRIIDLNARFCEISGYRREELLGCDHRLLNSGHHPREFWTTLWATLARGGAWRGEICNRRKDGSLYWVDSIIAAFCGENDKVERYVSILSDITDRKAAEARMSESEARFRNLADSAPMFVWTGDLQGERDYVNRPWLDFTGLSPDAVPLLLWESALHPDDRARCLNAFKDAAAARSEVEVEYRLRRHDGAYRDVLDRAVPRFDTEGGFAGFVGAAIDVTELREARAKAESASRAKSAFLANMSHEIRTPLTAILGFTELLRDDGDLAAAPESRLHAIETIRQAGNHLMTVISDILDLSKIEADQMRLEKVATRPLGLLQEVDALMRGRAIGKGVALELLIGGPIPEQIWADPTRIRQILMNLVGNAVKFTEQGRVRVIARAEARSTLIIDVEDTGPGLTPEQSSRLFESFAQADETVTRNHGGTGLGLTICRRLANLMGGSVVLARTEVAVGSCFRLTVPLDPVEGTSWSEVVGVVIEAPRPSGASPQTRLSGRILLAEDGPDNQRLIAFHLKMAGAVVDVADNGAIALEMVSSAHASGAPYDLLLTDMQMPVLDGYELSRALRSAGNSLPIVALTAHAMVEDRQRCLDAGCDDYTSKPVDRVVLIQMCATWMGRTGAKVG
ncbi:MAG: PAS domain S-box protein [Myxococcales bacterium]|nr:PAS domain S-box protein [Myxococcales bacterium]